MYLYGQVFVVTKWCCILTFCPVLSYADFQCVQSADDKTILVIVTMFTNIVQHWELILGTG